MGLPDGWNDYNRIGNQIEGTRFVAFKVPLREGVNKACSVPDEKQLYPKLLLSLIPKLGLVIDLTNTTKYYNPDEFLKLGVQYQKIAVIGQKVPDYSCSQKFRDAVTEFLNENQENGKLIGVHCTHGLNRSGFLICRYMIEEMKIPQQQAIAAFEEGRGHKMKRENYIEKLMHLSAKDEIRPKIPKIQSLAINTDVHKYTQTMPGSWIDELSIPLHHRSQNYGRNEESDQIQKQVQLIGCVNVQRSNLIPDGKGGYFVHITKKDIQRREQITPPPNRGNHFPPPPNKHWPHNNRQYGQVKPKFSRWSHDYPITRNDLLPVSSNNISQDLLRMHNMNPNQRGNRPNQQF